MVKHEEVMKPSQVNLDNNLQNVFGEYELEHDSVSLIKWLAGHGDTWETHFRLGDVPIDPTRFAIMVSAGWIEHIWFPKGAFTVTREFVERLAERSKK